MGFILTLLTKLNNSIKEYFRNWNTLTYLQIIFHSEAPNFFDIVTILPSIPRSDCADIVLYREQKMFTKMLPGIECTNYEERLLSLALFSLGYQRLKGILKEI